MNKKDKKFIEDFIKLYLKRRKIELTLMASEKKSLLKEKLKKLNQENKRYLLKYPLIFEKDMKVVRKIFRRVVEREKAGSLIKGSFELFLRNTLEELYKEKIVDKKTYELVKNSLRNVDLRTDLGYLRWAMGRV